jgi:phenylacetate-CoA oxygenase PaaI subunit
MSEFLKDREADLRDAPAAVEADVDAFSPEARRAILGLLVTLGDNKYKLGRRYSEWATSGPTLEASVAAASMTSDEMGHARALYPLLRKFPDAPPELRKEEDRTEFANVSFLDEPFAKWTDFIAAAALFDRAMNVVIRSMRESAYGPFRHRAKKMLQEEQYHLLYADGWLETLAAGDGTREELKESLNRYWVETLAWFGPDDDPVFSVAAADRILDADGPTLRERFVAEVREAVGPATGIGFPDTRDLPWGRWNAANRRLG